MDPLGALVNVSHLIRRVLHYLKSIKEGGPARKALLLELSFASGILDTLNDIALHSDDQDPWRLRILALASPEGPMVRYEHLVSKINSKLNIDVEAREESLRSKLSAGRRQLLWPFTQSDVADYLVELERHKSIFILELQAVHNDMAKSVSAKVDLIYEAVNETTNFQKQQQSHNLSQWFSEIDQSPQLQSILADCHTSKPNWVLEDPAVSNWIRNQTKFLWIRGIPGAGKTVAAATIIDHLSSTKLASNGDVLYFFCNYQHRIRDEHEMILRTLCRQIIDRRPELLPEFFRFQEASKSSFKPKPLAEDYQRLFLDILHHIPKLYLILDAIDECTENTRDRIATWIEEILKCSTKCSILITSRPNLNLYTDASEEVTPSHLNIVAHDDDMMVFITDSLRFHSKNPLKAIYQAREDLKMQAQISNTILEASHDVFLLAKLHIESVTRARTLRQMKSTLQSLKDGLHGAYKDTISRIEDQDAENRLLASRVISWTAHAIDPLRSEELLHALAMYSEPSMDLFDTDALYTNDHISSACCGMIVIEKDTQIVRFSHHTAQEYCISQLSSTRHAIQAEIFEICIRYLSLQPIRDTKSSVKMLQVDYPFLSYAARAWGCHASAAGPEEPVGSLLKIFGQSDTLALLLRLFGMNRVYPDPLMQPIWSLPSLTDSDDQVYLQSIDHHVAALYLAAYHGLYGVMKTLINSGININASIIYGSRAIHIASFYGHVEIVQLLLDSRASTTLFDDDGESALNVAARANQIRISTILVSSDRSLLDHSNHYGWTPLAQASARGFSELVSMFLGLGSDWSIKDLSGMTALHWAAETRGRDTRKCLLKSLGVRIAEIRSDDGRIAGDTVLHTLARWPKTLGLDPGQALQRSLTNVMNQTPLHVAAEHGQVTWVKYYLDRATDLNLKDLKGRTALDLARENGHEEVVSLIASHEHVTLLQLVRISKPLSVETSNSLV